MTLILDKGWGDSTAIETIRRVPEGERPHIEAAARIISVPDGYYPEFGTVIDPDDIAGVVASEAAAGEGWVKLAGDWPRRGIGPVSNFTEDQLGAAVAAAESAGARVAIHTMARGTPGEAVRAGVHSVEHGLFLTEADIAMLGSRQGSWVPTILRMESIVEQLGAESSGGRLILEGIANVQSLLPMAFEAGVHVLAGTDLHGASADIADEALRLKELGLSNQQVLTTTTSNGFVSIDRPDDFEIGTAADAVLFETNPLEEIGVLRHPKAIMRLGRLL